MRKFKLSIYLLPLFSLACTVDKDKDGFSEEEDCNDESSIIKPDAPDIVGDDIDQNCDGMDGTDYDLDGHASLASGGDDCDDHNAQIAGQTTYYQDYDGDGFGNSRISFDACSVPFRYVEDDSDCDDSNADINPNAEEICDYLDNDCDELTDDADDSVTDQINLYIDLDQDGFGTTQDSYQACFATGDYTENADDCDDLNPNINPNSIDLPYDEIDQNCDGSDGISEVTYIDVEFSSDTAIEAFCGEYDAVTVFGDILIDMTYIESNTTEALSCIVGIEGSLDIQNIRTNSTISFENLYYARDISLQGGLNYDFARLVEVDNISISANRLWPAFSGDSSFPNLHTINGTFTWFEGRGSELSGFTNLTSLRKLSILENHVLGEVSAFENITDLESLSIIDTHSATLSNLPPTPLLSLSGLSSLTSVTKLELINNGYLSTPTLHNLSSTSLVTISDNQRLEEDPCIYFTADTNLVLSTASHDNFDVGDCNIDGDSFSINEGDCDDQDPTLGSADLDGDGFSGCSGDCNDQDPTIHPNASEVWYDGVDQNCDGANDYDQDGDRDLAIAYGGADCNDEDAIIHTLDPDGDGSTTCGDSSEVDIVESCDDWRQAGFTADGVYWLSFSSGDSFRVYCDMTTDSGGWTLFAITNSSACAEELNFGHIQLFEFNHPYFSTRLNDSLSTEFLQDVRSDGERTDYTIKWSFFDGPDTLENRFLTAFSSGVDVSWEVDFNGYHYNYFGSWFFSDNAFEEINGQPSHPWNDWAGWDTTVEPAPKFSDDDGAWGAAAGEVNGNSSTPPTWGQAVSNVSDVSSSNEDDCSSIYINGEPYLSEQIKNLMYFR